MEDELIAPTGEDVAQPETAAPVEKSMDDTIRETLDAIQKRGESPADEEESPSRARDDKGRFAPKAAAESNGEAPTDPDPSAQDRSAAPPVPSVPPELQKLGLRKEEAEAIAAAGPLAMQAFVRRNEEMRASVGQLHAKAQFGSAMEQAVSPYMATIQSLGTTPDVAVGRLMAADHAMRYGTPQQKAAMVAKIAQDYGVDLAQVGQTNSEQAPQYMPDPQVTHLQTQLQQMQAWIQQQNQQREWQERQTLDSEIARFQQDPKHNHFEAVRADMAAMLQAGIASSLEDAYERAIYANPTVRAQVLAAQQAAADEARKAEAAQKAQAARRAAAVNMPRRGLMPAAKPVGSMDDTIRETAARLGLM